MVKLLIKLAIFIDFTYVCNENYKHIKLMKKTLTLLIFSLLIGCKESSIDQLLADGNRLVEIKSNGKTNTTFEYQNNKLVKENNFAFCDNPSDEFFYEYQGENLSQVRSITRGFYSNSSKICDPNSEGMRTTEFLEYENNRVVRITRSLATAAISTFIYNSNGLVEKHILSDKSGKVYSEKTYKYDFRGNIIEENGQYGKTIYEYDNKVNPLYLIKSRLHSISAFSNSPNNVIRASGVTNFERKITEYNDKGLPVKVIENNGKLVLEYIYQ